MPGQELTKDIIKNSISNPQKCGLTGKIACLDVDLSENELCDRCSNTISRTYFRRTHSVDCDLYIVHIS